MDNNDEKLELVQHLNLTLIDHRFSNNIIDWCNYLMSMLDYIENSFIILNLL